MPARAVSFDFGETLATLDERCLCEKLAGLGVAVQGDRILAALASAWDTYQKPAQTGSADTGGGLHPWKPLMAALLAQSGTSHPERHGELVDWLFEDQRRTNLWRKPIPGMIELVRELRARAVPVAILSNSEGYLVELIEQLGWTRDLTIVIDSGCVGTAKPDPAIFRRTADALGVPLDAMLHVGDSLRADVHGARNAGARALWFTTPPAHPVRRPPPAPDVLVCTNANEARDAIWTALALSDRGLP